MNVFRKTVKGKTNTTYQRLLAVSIVALLTNVMPGSNANAAQQVPTVIALFGDSITVGFNRNYAQVDIAGGTITNGFPTIYLNQLLNDGTPKRPSIVSNWGDGGSSSGDGVGRISRDLRSLSSVFDGEQRLVLIIYGTNDADFGISRSMTGFNTEQMIDRARRLGYEPVIGTLTPVSNRDVRPRNQRIVAAANDRRAFVVDHFTRFINQPGGWPTIIESDQGVRLHPTDEGYLVIAQTWFEERLANIIEPEPEPEPEPTAPAIPAIIQLLLD